MPDALFAGVAVLILGYSLLGFACGWIVTTKWIERNDD